VDRFRSVAPTSDVILAFRPGVRRGHKRAVEGRRDTDVVGTFLHPQVHQRLLLRLWSTGIVCRPVVVTVTVSNRVRTAPVSSCRDEGDPG
jgi:hypothetical protein